MAVTAEELISRVKVDGVAQFVSHMHQAADAAHHFGTSVMEVGRKVLDVTGIMEALTIAGLSAFGAECMSAASSTDAFKRSLLDITGSAELMESKFKFLQELGAHTNLPIGELREAGRQMEVFGLRMERYLPAMAKLTMAQGGGPEKLAAFVRIFGMLSQGQEPLMRSFIELGIGKAALAGAGVKFDADGKLLTSARETMADLLNLVETKYGQMGDIMRDAPSVAANAMKIRFEEVMATIGDSILKVVTPIMTELSGIFQRLVDSGVLSDLANRFKALFHINGDPILYAISALVVGLKKVPDVLDTIRSKVEPVLNFLRNHLQAIGALLFVMFSQKLIGTIVEVVSVVWRLVQALRAGVGMAAGLQAAMNPKGIAQLAGSILLAAGAYYALGAMIGGDTGANGGRSAMMGGPGAVPRGPDTRIPEDTLQQQIDQMMKGLKPPSGVGPEGKKEPIAPDTVPVNSTTTQQARDIRDIKYNTEPLRELKRNILGGGTLGQMGVTPVELAGLRGPGGNIYIQAGARAEDIKRMILQMRRQGLI
jgi:hypothetical protein